MNAEEILQKYPAQIRRVENESFDLKQQVEGARLRLKLREADIAVAIAAELEAAGKKSNAETREAMLRGKMQADDEAKALRRSILEDEARLQRMGSTLDFYRAIQQNARVTTLARAPSNLIFDEADLR